MYLQIPSKQTAGVRFGRAPNIEGIVLYNATGSALVVGEVVGVGYDDNLGQEFSAIAVATTAFPVKTAVALEAVAAGERGYFAVGGQVEALVEGTTDVAAGDFLKVLNTENSFKKDGTSRSTNSAAIAVDAQAANSEVLVTVILIPEQHQISAS